MLCRKDDSVAQEDVAEVCRAHRSDHPFNQMRVRETKQNVKFRFELHILVRVPHGFQT